MLIALLLLHGEVRSSIPVRRIQTPDRAVRKVLLVSPENRKVVKHDPLVFSWEFVDIPNSDIIIDRYEVSFWTEGRGYRRTYTVVVQDSAPDRGQLRFEDPREVMRRHGSYAWRVTAITDQGGRIVSGVRNLRVEVSHIQETFLPWVYPYAIEAGGIQRLKTKDYNAFLNKLLSTKPMEDYADLCLTFRQGNLLFRSLELQERLCLLSSVGIGFEVMMRFCLLRTTYFSLLPRISINSHWFSAGLEDYTSTLYSVEMGAEWSLMPRGFLTFRTSYIPVYRIRYTETGGGLRTFQGEGWEWGARIIIPNHIMRPIRILGLEIDFQRIPIGIYASRIRDDYTGTVMNNRRYTVGYLLR